MDLAHTFRKAIRENTTCLIGLAGESGSGKTYSALRFARGLVGASGKIAAIDTEARRMLHYAELFEFDHVDLAPPFSPARYVEMIEAAEKAGYHAIIIDSMSHEWAGDGGCIDMHDQKLDQLAGDDAAKAERMNVLAWKDAKMAHKRMMSRFLQCRAHLIFCLRAEEKIKFVKVEGKLKIEPAGWQPICEKNFMYEMTTSFMLHSDLPGIPVPMKLQEQHKPFFDLGRPLDEKAGKLFAEWCAGAKATRPDQSQAAAPAPYTDDEIILHLNGSKTVADRDKWADLARSIKDDGKKQMAREAYNTVTQRLRRTPGAQTN